MFASFAAMKRAIAIADRWSGPAIKLFVALNLLFFLAFAASLVLSTKAVLAEGPACTGKDLSAELKADKPAELAAAEAEAAKVPNGKGLLWKLEKQGVEPSYLFGTMHMTDPRVTSLTPEAQKAFDASKTVVIETTDVVDQSKMMEAMAKHPELMMFTDSTTLQSLLTPEQLSVVEKGLAARNIPIASVSKMKPWILAAMISLPACETARKATGAPVLDIKLAQDAQASGKALKGLESALDQLGAMASLPIKFHIDGLVDALRLGDRMDDIMETMITLYTKGETALIMPVINQVSRDEGVSDAGYAEFEQTMITKRNVTMAKNADPILAEGGVFIAVGALHLPGPEGLVEEFRKAGYTVTPAG